MDNDKKKDTPENENVSEELINDTENDEGIPITAPEESEKEVSETPAEIEMCILCEKNAPDKSHGEDYDLCAECRKKLIYSRFRFKGILALLAIIVFASWGFSYLAKQGAEIEAISEGYELLEEEKPQSALYNFGSTTNMGWKTAKNLVKKCLDIGSIDNASYLLSTYFYDENAVEEGDTLTWAEKAGRSDINAPWNKELKETYDFINELNGHANIYSKDFMSYSEQLYYGEIKVEDVPYDELIDNYNKLEEAAKTDLEKGVINYYKLALASICEADPAEQYGFCLKVSEYIPECPWMFMENLVMLSIQQGKYDEADSWIAKMREINSENVYADIYSSLSLRYQGKYDEAIKGFEAIVADIDNNQAYDAYYELLVCHFLKGEYEKALEYARHCVEDESYLTYEAIYFYAMLSKQTGYDAGYDNAVALLASGNEKLSPTVDKYISGEITAEDIFKDGEVVFE